MDQQTELRSLIEEDYTFEGDSFCLGAAMLDEQTLTGCHVNVPLKTLNRHGLISCRATTPDAICGMITATRVPKCRLN